MLHYCLCLIEKKLTKADNEKQEMNINDLCTVISMRSNIAVGSYLIIKQIFLLYNNENAELNVFEFINLE